MSSLSSNDSKSSLNDSKSSLKAVAFASSVKEPTINDSAPLNDPPIIFSNIKSQGRVMMFDEETIGFKTVPDDQLVVCALDGSARSLTNHDRKPSFHKNTNSFDFKLLARKFSL
ncbi:unnamed protein product [Cylindrotheca closterium]|uniref:Uncharacterized protein n=1 Tax=Cylindrotheca closterium TaxID=2856 RepID=A0AAD2GBK1_9STRA|nr:unnamed protein product [Cylindrotheca closterium]